MNNAISETKPEQLTMMEAEELNGVGLSVVDGAKALIVTDQKTYDAAGKYKLEVVKPMRQKFIDAFGDEANKAHKLWKSLVAKRDGGVRPCDEAEAIINRIRGQFEAEQERVRAKEQARIDEENRKVAEQNQLDEAVAVEQAGGNKQEVDAVLKAPPQVQKTVVQPSFQRTEGVRMGTRRWSAIVDSKFKLIMYVSKNPAEMHLLDANMPSLNAKARSQRERMNIPGVRPVSIRL